MAAVTKPNARGAYNREGRHKYLNREEGGKFVRHASSLPQRQALFCLTIYYTGCRISEALALRRQNIDAEAKTMLIRSLKKRDRHEIRRLPVPAFLVDGLLLIAHSDETKPLWAFSRTTGWRTIKRVMKTAGIEGIHATAKGLWHGFGVRGAMVQIPMNLIQNWMVHSDPMTTAIYLAVKDEEERELIQKTW